MDLVPVLGEQGGLLHHLGPGWHSNPGAPIGSLTDTPIPAFLLVQQATTLPQCWSRLLFLVWQRHRVGRDELLKCISVNNSCKQFQDGQGASLIICSTNKSLYCFKQCKVLLITPHQEIHPSLNPAHKNLWCYIRNKCVPWIPVIIIQSNSFATSTILGAAAWVKKGEARVCASLLAPSSTTDSNITCSTTDSNITDWISCMQQRGGIPHVLPSYSLRLKETFKHRIKSKISMRL